MEFLDLALPIVYLVVGCALIWLIVEAALAFRKTRKAAEDLDSTVCGLSDQIKPTLAHVEKIAADLSPAAEKIDPLLDRASLTLDAADLEIMRVDQILEDVSQVTDTAVKALAAVDSVASAPRELVGAVTDKIRDHFAAQSASEESMRLGAAGDQDRQKPIRDLVDAASDAVKRIHGKDQSR